MTGPANLGPTPSQTIGPFFSFAMEWLADREGQAGEATRGLHIHGQVLDGDGAPVPDAMIEIFQGAAFGRALTDADGRYRVTTRRPDADSDSDGDGEGQAPHLDVSVFGRGLLQRLHTRIYLPDEQAANAADPLLQAVADPDRRSTLVATPDGDGLRFDIRLQGAEETVFLAW